MKTKIISIIIIALFSVANMFAQNSYQTFTSAGFKVKCGCRLYVNSTFIKMAKQQGANNIVAAYICAENEDDPESGVIVNINVYNEAGSYKKVTASNYSYFEKKCLDQYALNLSKAGIPYTYITYQGVSALEYSFDQLGLPTKAIMFFKNKRSYLLQVGTRNGLTTKFNALKTSFVLI